MGGKELASLLRQCRFRYADESQLQAGIEQVLQQCSIPHTREARIGPHNRIDFLVDDIGIEVKIKGSGPIVERQLRRYARLDEINELILVTTRTRHLHVPEEIEGKALHTVWLSLQGL